MRFRCSILTLVAAVSTAAFAQHLGPPAHFQGRSQGFHSGFNHSAGMPILYPLPFYDSLAWDYPPAYTAQPSVVIVQPPAPPQVQLPPAPPADPLVIELRGDTYVQLSGSKESQSQMLRPATDATLRPRGAAEDTPAASKAHQTLPALLVFSDGHREEVSGYTITNGLLYAKADYYSGGAWNRTIQLSSLNLPETIQSNQARGVLFRLPGSPNEVMVGP